MKIAQCVVTILFTSLLIQGSQQACLTTAQLNALGFTVSANFTAAGNSSSICTDLYSNGGNCVDPSQVQTVFNTNQANLQANAQASVNLNAAINSVLTAINSITNLVSNITANLTSTLNSTLTNLNNTLTNITANTSVNASVTANGTTRTLQSTSTSANASVYASTGNSLQTILNNSNKSINACYQAYQNVVNGIYCYLTSNQASANTVVSANGTTTNVVVNVNTDATGNALNACIPVLDSYCLITYGISITNNSTVFTGIFDASANSTGQVSLATCQTLQNNYNCTTTACQTTIKNTLINNVFSATSVNFVQSKAYTDATANAGASLTTLFGSGRTLQASPNNSSNVQTQSSSNGQDVNKNGQNSGANTTTYGSSANLFSAVFILLITFLYA